ncbi:MAG: Gfo/Idh/MocA family oxidoreductase [Aeromicrobium erythreum]
MTGPNFIHRDVAVAAARAGKHLWVEKPAGRDASETAEIVAAVEAAGVQAAAGFNYRNVPAVELAKELVASGRIGRVEHSTVRFLADYSADPDAALSWRFRTATSGTGVLGDLVSHAADLLRHVVADVEELVVDRATFIAQRREAVAGAMHYEKGAGELGDVENEDYVSALLRLADGSRAVLESSRVAVGEQNRYGLEVHGTEGSLSWDFRRMNELQVSTRGADGAYLNAFSTTRYATPGDGELGVFQPGANNPMGFDDLKVVEARRLVESIATGKPVGATVHGRPVGGPGRRRHDHLQRREEVGTTVSNTRLRVGVVGAGAMGAAHARTLATSVPGAEVVRVFDMDTERAKQVAHGVGAEAADSAEALVADVDAFVVASPDFTHADLAVAGIEAGKHVLCEKPLAVTADDARRVVDAELAAGRRFVQVGFKPPLRPRLRRPEGRDHRRLAGRRAPAARHPPQRLEQHQHRRRHARDRFDDPRARHLPLAARRRDRRDPRRVARRRRVPRPAGRDAVDRRWPDGHRRGLRERGLRLRRARRGGRHGRVRVARAPPPRAAPRLGPGRLGDRQRLRGALRRLLPDRARRLGRRVAARRGRRRERVGRLPGQRRGRGRRRRAAVGREARRRGAGASLPVRAMSFTLAVCSEMVLTELPHLERVRRIHDAGFAVEIWDWTQKDAEALRATGASFTSMTGYVTGDLTTPGGADDLLRTAEESIPFAQAIGCPSLNIHGTGLGEGGLPVRPVEVTTGEDWVAAVRTLERVAELAERHDVTYVLENLNTAVDHPGTPFARAADTLALVRAVGSPHLRMNLDLYHAQIGEGNLVELVRDAVPVHGGGAGGRRPRTLRARHRRGALVVRGAGSRRRRLHRRRGDGGLGERPLRRRQPPRDGRLPRGLHRLTLHPSRPPHTR